MRSHEDIVVFSKRAAKFNQHLNDNDCSPSSVLTFPAVPFKQRVHTAEKPIALLEYLIKLYTNEGDVVLDPTMGSGTAGVAAYATNR
eukprot:6637-Eustigmatos_ZCMA.PRE.1